jgi:asparagine synthase (glutamine-hydrolysing)
MLRKTFAHLLPKEIISRSKKGFEVPLERWLQSHLRNRIEKEWLSNEALQEHMLFTESEVKNLQNHLWTGSSPDAPARIWALIVFQQWWKNYKQYIVLPSHETMPASS